MLDVVLKINLATYKAGVYVTCESNHLALGFLLLISFSVPPFPFLVG